MSMIDTQVDLFTHSKLKVFFVGSLKVHKIENFFDSDFEICIIFVSYVKILRFYKKIFDWAIIGGGKIFPRSPRTTGNEKKF
jgi:hypothetical protein